MRIIVDEVPDFPSDCLFSEPEWRHGGYMRTCNISDVICYKELGDDCPYLMSLTEVKHE